jgi:hypothetical protein
MLSFLAGLQTVNVYSKDDLTNVEINVLGFDVCWATAEVSAI